METELALNLVDTFAVGMLLLSMLSMAASRMGQIIRYFSLQSLLLAAMAAVSAQATGNTHIYILAAVTLAIKVVIIPRFLRYTMAKINVEREVDTLVGIPGSLLLSAALIMAAYFVTEPLMGSFETLTRNCLALSLSVVFVGLLMMCTRRKAVTEAVGLLMMENGLFLGVMSVSYGMPLLVELGIFLDVLMAVVIIGIFAYRINRTFNSVDTGFLRRLKE